MTYAPKSDFLQVLLERGYYADCTDIDGLDDALLAGVVPAYIGYDATAASLHVGHLMNIMVLRWLQQCGGKPITLMGGGTTKVGDPSFRSEERPLLPPEQILITQFSPVLGTHVGPGAIGVAVYEGEVG